MKKLILALVFIATIICCTACGPRITHGEVYAMEHLEETVTVEKDTKIRPVGKVFIPRKVYYKVHYPERYVIHVRNFENGEEITEDFYVSKEVYDQLNIGDVFEFDEQRGDLDEEPRNKESISSIEYEDFLKGEEK